MWINIFDVAIKRLKISIYTLFLYPQGAVDKIAYDFKNRCGKLHLVPEYSNL